jgi:hypothetical protein
VVRALRRVGGPVRFGHGGPGDPAGTVLVARLCRSGGSVRLTPEKGPAAETLPRADDFDLDGVRLKSGGPS